MYIIIKIKYNTAKHILWIRESNSCIVINKYGIIGMQYACLQHLLFFLFIAKFNNLAFWPVNLNCILFTYHLCFFKKKKLSYRRSNVFAISNNSIWFCVSIYLFCTCRAARQCYHRNRHHRRMSTLVARISHFRKCVVVVYIQHGVLAVQWWSKPMVCQRKL